MRHVDGGAGMGVRALKNLLGRLMGRSYDELKKTATALQLPPFKGGQNELAVLLYRELMDEMAVKWVWDEMSSAEHQFLHWLMEQRGMAAFVDSIPLAMTLAPDEVERMLAHLSRLGVVDVEEVTTKGNRVTATQYRFAYGANMGSGDERQAVSISNEVARVLKKLAQEITEPPRFDASISKLFDYYELAQLEQIALAWRLKFTQPAYYKEEVADLLLEALSQPERVANMVSILPPSAKAIYDLLRQHGGRMKLVELRKQAGLAETDLRQSLRHLAQRFLVLETYERATRTFFIPKDILQPHVPVTKEPPPLELLDGEPTTKRVVPGYALAWDILSVLNFVQQNQVTLTAQDSRIPKRLVKRINDMLLVQEQSEGRLDLVLHAALSLDLLEQEGSLLVTTPRTEDWAANLTFASQQRRLFKMWLDDRRWFEPMVMSNGYWWGGDITAGRKQVVGKLAALEPGRWYSALSLLHHIEQADPFVFRSKADTVRYLGYRNLTRFHQEWPQREGRLLLNVVETGLHWLGMVDTGYDAEGNFVAFRIKPEAMELLQSGGEGKLPKMHTRTHKMLLLQPNFEVLVFHPESGPLWRLLKFTDLARHDMVSVYTITRESVTRALEGDMSVADILKFLAEESQREVPQNVARSIEDWGRSIKRVRLSDATILEVDDPSVLDELAASRKTASYLVRRLSPTHALVNLPETNAWARDSAMQKVAKALKAAGYSTLAFERSNGHKNGRSKEE